MQTFRALKAPRILTSPSSGASACGNLTLTSLEGGGCESLMQRGSRPYTGSRMDNLQRSLNLVVRPSSVVRLDLQLIANTIASSLQIRLSVIRAILTFRPFGRVLMSLVSERPLGMLHQCSRRACILTLSRVQRRALAQVARCALSLSRFRRG